MKSPAFQFYPDDFIGGTVDMTTEDVGAYIRLLCYQWGRGSIPPTKSAVDRVAGCVVTPEVIAKFPDGKNQRIESERIKQQAWRDKQRQAGLASGRARANIGSTTVQPPLNGTINQNPTLHSPSPSPSPSPSLVPFSIPSRDGNKGNGISGVIPALVTKLNSFFKRTGSFEQWSYAEQTSMVQVVKREACLLEFGEIQKLRDSINPEKVCYDFPESRTLLKLLEGWNSALDRARAGKVPSEKKQPDRSKFRYPVMKGKEWIDLTFDESNPPNGKIFPNGIIPQNLVDGYAKWIETRKAIAV